jgi:hypothetical protein
MGKKSELLKIYKCVLKKLKNTLIIFNDYVKILDKLY